MVKLACIGAVVARPNNGTIALPATIFRTNPNTVQYLWPAAQISKFTTPLNADELIAAGCEILIV